MAEYHIIVPGFDSIIGQQNPIRLLKTFLSNGTLPHALLFTGIEGIGKRLAAREVALALNCLSPRAVKGDQFLSSQACGMCTTCRQIVSKSHPDVHLIEPQGNLLRIDQIRKLIQTLAMKPFSARHRVAVIAQAQAMNMEAANALLKILEEPPEHTTLILTAQHRSELLPTIVSRCRQIAFNPLSSTDLKTLLADKLSSDPSRMNTVVAMAGGSFTMAQKLANNDWQKQRNWVIRAAGLDIPGELNERTVTSALAFSAQLAQQKESVQELLNMLKSWIRDLSIRPYQPQQIINRDRESQIDALRSRVNETQLLALWETVEIAQKDIAARANLRLTLDIMALRMVGLAAI
jgi:DNA polymerase-3 subunit delta'